VNGSGNSMPSNESSATTSLPNPTTPGATFVGTDQNTVGNWQGHFGADGYNVISGGSSYPGYATVDGVGKTDYQWSDHTSDARALANPAAGNRVIGCWFAANTFNIDVNLIDGTWHKLALYFVDWDQLNRTEKIELLDMQTGAVLDTRTVSNFLPGIYLQWNVKGQVRFRLTSQNGSNVIVNGLFFDASDVVAQATPSSLSGGVVGGNFQLVVNGQTGQKFDIYASNDLVTWTKVSTISLTTKSYNFSDNTAQGQPRRFYRAVAVP
jgi:hypothetical protein